MQTIKIRQYLNAGEQPQTTIEKAANIIVTDASDHEIVIYLGAGSIQIQPMNRKQRLMAIPENTNVLEIRAADPKPLGLSA